MLDQIGMVRKKYREHTGWVYTVSWLHNQPHQRLASAGRDKTIRVWNVPEGDALSTLHEHKKRINGVACSPDGQYIASASEDKTVRIYRLSASLEVFCLKDHRQPVNCVAWSPKQAPNGDLLLASGGDDAIARVWQLTPSENNPQCSQKATFQNHFQTQILKRQIDGTGINALAWSADGQLIASAGDDKTVRLWKADTGQEIGYFDKHQCRINALAWSADNTLIASAGDDKTVRIWEAATRDEVQIIKPDPPANFIRWVVARFHQERRQNSAYTSRPLPTPRPLSFSIVTTLAWSPSLGDQKLAFASQKVVHIFEGIQRGDTPTCIYTHQQHTDWVRTVAWSPDGRLIASAGDDREVHVWNVASSPRIADPHTTSVDNP